MSTDFTLIQQTKTGRSMGRATNLRRLQDQRDGGGEALASSSTDSNCYYNNPLTSSSSSSLCTDLRLGLTISSSSNSGNGSLFVKVYKEGIPIGRKLDLMSHDGYHSLLPTLSHMFNIPILCPSVNYENISERDHILIYEDKDGDWMLVGDGPWEMFLSSVKKLKITKANAW